MESPSLEKKTTKGRLLLVVGIILIVLILVPPAAFAAYYHSSILPGVYVDGADLGGLTRNEARIKILAAIEKIKEQGIIVTNGKRSIHLENKAAFNPDDALERAFAIGRTGNIFSRAGDGTGALLFGRRVPVSAALAPKELDSTLRTFFWENEKAAVDAKLVISMNGNYFSGTSVSPESYGLAYDYADAEEKIADMLVSLNDLRPIKLKEIQVAPAVFSPDVESVKDKVEAALKFAPVTIQAEDKKAVLSAKALAAMLTVKKDEGTPALALDADALSEFIKTLADQYDIKASDTYLEIDTATNRMTSFKAGRDGRELEVEKTGAAINESFASFLATGEGLARINAVTKIAKSQVVSATASELGIKEVLGTGRSNYFVSPANRIKNIAHGVAKLNGRLIAPDETFSMIAALSPFTIEDGYFPELVILGDSIEPAIGGGLCQIGTTTFRAAMNSGLPILERQNHSLVISHYLDPANNLPGTDATIYDPVPDLKFKNDTGHWILFTADMDTKTGDLAFSFWGTPDGRKGFYSAPKVSRWISYDPEVKNIETDTLEPGKTKCQNAFRGADASFVYTVEKPDGTKEERTFTSHYKPLQKICLVGKAAEEEPPPDGTTPETPAPTAENPVLPPDEN